MQQTPLLEVRIFGNNGEPMQLGIIPNRGVNRIAQTDFSDVDAPGVKIGEQAGRRGERF
jgi:hypothetical protein